MNKKWFLISCLMIFFVFPFMLFGCASQSLWIPDSDKDKTLYEIKAGNSTLKLNNHNEIGFEYAVDEPIAKQYNFPPAKNGCVFQKKRNSYMIEHIISLVEGPINSNIQEIDIVATKKLMIRRNFGARVLDKVILARFLGSEETYKKDCKGEPKYNIHMELTAKFPENYIIFNRTEEQNYIIDPKDKTEKKLLSNYYSMFEPKIHEKLIKENINSKIYFSQAAWIKNAKKDINQVRNSVPYSGILFTVRNDEIKQIKILFDDETKERRNVKFAFRDTPSFYWYFPMYFEKACCEVPDFSDREPVIDNYTLNCYFRLKKSDYHYNLPTRIILTPVALVLDIITFPIVALVGLSGFGPPA